MIQSLVVLLMLYIESSTHLCHCKIIIILNEKKSGSSSHRELLLGLTGKGQIENMLWLFAKTFPCGKGLDGLRASGLNLHTVQLIMACLLVESGEVLPQNLSTSFQHVPSSGVVV